MRSLINPIMPAATFVSPADVNEDLPTTIRYELELDVVSTLVEAAVEVGLTGGITHDGEQITVEDVLTELVSYVDGVRLSRRDYVTAVLAGDGSEINDEHARFGQLIETTNALKAMYA